MNILFIVLLLLPVGFGYRVYNDFSGKLRIEQFDTSQKKKVKGYSFTKLKKEFYNVRRNKCSFPFQVSCCSVKLSTNLKTQQSEYLIAKDKAKFLLPILLFSSSDDIDKLS